jgi:hypothetical protein
MLFGRATMSNAATNSSNRPTNSAAAGEVSVANGYWLVASDGGVFNFGGAGFYGSTGNVRLNQPVVGMASTPDGHGYWLVASDGGVFHFGDAAFYGSTGNVHLNQPIVGMASTPDGHGYWLVAKDGGVFEFGDAGFYGSTGNVHLNQPIVGMASTPDGHGYWLVAKDGGVFEFGDAGFDGSTGNVHLNQPIVGMASTADGHGYWLVASDGGVFEFGDAGFYGSTGNVHLNQPVVSMASTPDAHGYWLAASDGGIFNFGDGRFYGSTGNIHLNQPVVGMAESPGSTVPLSITTSGLPEANDGTSYSATLMATGGSSPYTWSVASGSLPRGLSLSPSGTISGTPTVGGTSNFTVQVTDSSSPIEGATKALSITVGLRITNSSSLPNAVAEDNYSVSLSASGGVLPYTWTVTAGSPPPGLNLDPSTGVISGIPTSIGTYLFDVEVTDSSTPTHETAAGNVTITVVTSSNASGNWSGYAVGSGPYTGVTGTFTVPSLYANTPDNESMSAWVGIDGYSDDDNLIQAGIQEIPDPQNPDLFYLAPWYEVLPAAETLISGFAVAPGDQISVTIQPYSGTTWSISLANEATGQTYSTNQYYDGPATSSEWITEAPTLDGNIVPLAPFTPSIAFTTLGFDGTSTSLYSLYMVQNGVRVATPSSLTNAGFSVAYGSAYPPPPGARDEHFSEPGWSRMLGSLDRTPSGAGAGADRSASNLRRTGGNLTPNTLRLIESNPAFLHHVAPTDQP